MIPLLVALLMAFQSPAADDDQVLFEHVYVDHIVKVLPAWEADTLAQYEQNEIDAVKADLKECDDAAEDIGAFLTAAHKLHGDAGHLQALDDSLLRDWVI